MSAGGLMGSHLMIVDWSNLVARARFVLRDRVATELPGLCRSMMQGLIGRWAPTHLMVAQDSPVPCFRVEQIPGYKGDRVGREGPSTRELTDLLRPHLEAWNVASREADAMEADDVIATLVAKATQQGLRASVVSRDTDLLQLVSDAARVVVLWPEKGNEQVMDEAAVLERTGVRPRQLLDFRVMVGAKDNLERMGWTAAEVQEAGHKAPHGFTEKRARELLAAAGSLDALYGPDAELLKPREEEWLRTRRVEAMERRDALRLRTGCELIGNGGSAKVSELTWDGRPAPRCSRCGGHLDDAARLYGVGSLCTACGMKSNAKPEASCADCGTSIPYDPVYEPDRCMSCALTYGQRYAAALRGEVVCA